MNKPTILLLLGTLCVAGGGALLIPHLLGAEDTPILRWSAADETEVPHDPADPETLGAGSGDGAAVRTGIEFADTGAGADDRVEVVLRGRVVDKWKAPVKGATVWLDFGRGGQRGGPAANRQRRVPDPVLTDAEGRFAFQGQAFRNLRVSLQVAHERHAVGVFDKDVGNVSKTVDLGDLVLMSGGELRGRVTDLDGNGIPGAELRLQPENANALRMLRDRDRLLPTFTTDNNGFFRRRHLGTGDWSVTATAKRHTESRSPTFAVEEEQVTDIDDIRLGPGFEVTGIVRNGRGEPVAAALVVMQSEGRPRGDNPESGPGRQGPGGRGGGAWAGFAGGREHRTTTDAEGRFALEHLPGVPMRLAVDADGYLDYRQSGIDPTLGQLLQVALQDGLRIEGRVKDSDNAPVTKFAVWAIRVRGLPAPGQANVDIGAMVDQWRQGNIDESTLRSMRAELGEQFGNLRAMLGREAGRDRRGPGQGPGPGQEGGRAFLRDFGGVEAHPQGRFTVTGLQEGIYEVHVQSPDHSRYRSAEIELRSGMAPPSLEITLDSGVYVAGVVLDAAGTPIAGAQVELRAPSAWDGLGRRLRSGRGDNNGGPGASPPDLNGIAREFARATAGAQGTLEARTDRDGVFVIKHAARGTWSLHAEARGHAAASTEAFELTADRSGFELRLGALGSIAGTVHGLRDGEAAEARVAAVPLPSSDGNGAPFAGMAAMFGRGRGGPGGGGPFQSVGVEPDGSYRIADLVPGEYLVRSWVGSVQDLMRELGPRFADGSLRADVVVRANETARLNLEVTRSVVGSVHGSVVHNNAPGAGLQVELQRVDESGTGSGRGRGGMGMMGGGFPGFGRSFQSAVANSGRFSFDNVPPGAYRLRVQHARRGGTLHEEVVQVVANAIAERTIVVQTHALRGRVTRDDGGNPAELAGRVSLLPGLTAPPENLNEWLRNNPAFEARLQNGQFQFDALQPGGYLLVVTARGRERTHQSIVVQGDQEVVVPAGKAVAGDAGAAPTPRTPGNRR